MPNTPVTWLNQFLVNTVTTGSQSDPDIIQLANGNMLVSWTSDDNTAGTPGSPTGLDVIGQIYDPLGNRVGGEIRLNNSYFFDEEQDMDLAALPGGGFISVFEDTDAFGTSIRLNEYGANGVQVSGNNTVVSDASLADPNYRNPVIAASSATSVLIAYEKTFAGGVVGIRFVIYNSVADSYGIELILATPGTDADVTVLTNGNYVVTANVPGADNSIVYRIINSAGGYVTDPLAAAGTNLNAANDFEGTVTALPGGGFVIAWTNNDGTDTDILFRVYNSAGAETGGAGVVAFDPGNSNNNNEPKVIALADGSFVIACDNDEVNGLNVQHFSAAGAPLSGVFNVSADNAFEISGVSLADGRMAIAWSAFNGEIQMEILDTRDVVNNPVNYTTAGQWQIGTVNADVFTTNASAEIIHGYDGADVITESGNLSQSVYGDGGNDTIIPTSTISSDQWDGGAGAGDTINWSLVNETGATFDLALATATAAGGALFELILNFENLIGTVNRDIIIGSAAANYLDGGLGNDDINGGGGADLLVGGSGNDAIHGDGENDTLLMDDFANPGATIGNDSGFGDAGNDLLWGYGGSDNLFGGADNDSLVGNDYGVAVTGTDGLYGGAGNDILFVGLAGNAYMDGGTGNDTFFGGLSNDQLRGQTGNDFLYGNSGADNFLFYNFDFANGDSDIVYFVNAGDKLQFNAALNGNLFFQNLASLEYAPGLFTTGVYITAFLGGGATAVITVYGTTVVALTPMVEFTL
jgi:RTX calcium-binding nonapeptide repeat (4 copies)